jgi:hypothetical protein
VIELVLPDPKEIDVVRQAYREAVPGWNRGNLNQENPFFKNPASQHADVGVEGGNVRELKRLGVGEKESHFFQQIVADPDDGCAGVRDLNDGRFCSGHHGSTSLARARECARFAIDRNRHAPITQA